MLDRRDLYTTQSQSNDIVRGNHGLEYVLVDPEICASPQIADVGRDGHVLLSLRIILKQKFFVFQLDRSGLFGSVEQNYSNVTSLQVPRPDFEAVL